MISRVTCPRSGVVICITDEIIKKSLLNTKKKGQGARAAVGP